MFRELIFLADTEGGGFDGSKTIHYNLLEQFYIGSTFGKGYNFCKYMSIYQLFCGAQASLIIYVVRIRDEDSFINDF